jgi:hypothetical protein
LYIFDFKKKKKTVLCSIAKMGGIGIERYVMITREDFYHLMPWQRHIFSDAELEITQFSAYFFFWR